MIPRIKPIVHQLFNGLRQEYLDLPIYFFKLKLAGTKCLTRMYHKIPDIHPKMTKINIREIIYYLYTPANAQEVIYTTFSTKKYA